MFAERGSLGNTKARSRLTLRRIYGSKRRLFQTYNIPHVLCFFYSFRWLCLIIHVMPKGTRLRFSAQKMQCGRGAGKKELCKALMPVFLCETETHKFRECEGRACASRISALRKLILAQDRNSAERNFVMRRRARLETTERRQSSFFRRPQADTCTSINQPSPCLQTVQSTHWKYSLNFSIGIGLEYL